MVVALVLAQAVLPAQELRHKLSGSFCEFESFVANLPPQNWADSAAFEPGEVSSSYHNPHHRKQNHHRLSFQISCLSGPPAAAVHTARIDTRKWYPTLFAVLVFVFAARHG